MRNNRNKLMKQNQQTTSINKQYNIYSSTYEEDISSKIIQTDYITVCKCTN